MITSPRGRTPDPSGCPIAGPIPLPHRRPGSPRVRLGAWLAMAALLATMAPAFAQTAVVTYHFDAARTGWNPTETVLTPQSVGTVGPEGGFGLRATVALDGAVDAQPLVVPGVRIAGDRNAGKHDVVYVATEANTIFAIDPTAGTILLSRNFGPPVTSTHACGTPDEGVGITSAPVIDLQHFLLYVVVYTNETLTGGATAPVYRLHALDLATLADRMPPVVIAGSQTLTNGATLAFSAALQRQRPALLEYGGTIYTAFGSFADCQSASRGWVFGWSADTLRPVNQAGNGTPTGMLTNRQTAEPTGVFLSTIWMAGAGPAGDEAGIYYVTGNSDPTGTSYSPVANLANSVIRLSPSTTTVLDVFTPSVEPSLDVRDLDFGSGGVMLVPSTAPGQPPMVAAAGKSGILYLLDRSDLGGYTPGGPDKVLARVPIGPCSCAPAYFNDGKPTLVSSGGKQLILWTVQASPVTALVQRAASPPLLIGSGPGFFTSVSSNGAGPPVVWAVRRRLSVADPRVWLLAFGLDAPDGPLKQLFAAPAGIWTEQHHSSDIVPVVVNGRVYVASDHELAIFGLGPVAAP